MGGQTPEWLQDILVEALQNAGATATKSDLEAEASYLVAKWDAPGRPVHNGRYLATLLERLDEFEGATFDLALLGLAACYRGAGADLVWDTLGGTPRANFRPSLQPKQRLINLGVPVENAERVDDLVAKLNSVEIPTDDLEAQILFDADLAILASSPQIYRRFHQSLRTECSGLDDRSFLRARREFIQALLMRRKIFLTPFAQHLAKAARDNLEGELSRIDQNLADSAVDARERPHWDHGSERNLDSRRARSIMIRHSRRHHDPVPLSETDSPAHGSMGNSPDSGRQSTKLPHDVDDTSTLESMDDPFSHRRDPRP